jgi:hypothetical protein
MLADSGKSLSTLWLLASCIFVKRGEITPRR